MPSTAGAGAVIILGRGKTGRDILFCYLSWLEMKKEIDDKVGIQTNYVSILIGFLLLIGLYLTSLYSYNLFHSLAELFSIVVAAGIFMVAWNSRKFSNSDYFLYIGIAYLFIGGMDLLHTLAYKGMGVFSGYDANLPTQLWIAGRYLEGIALFISPFVLGKKLRSRYVFTGFLAAFSILLVSIFYLGVFPDAFIEGSGLTPFKRVSEFVVSLILFGAIALLSKKREHFDPNVLRLLIASIAITIFSEMAFTLYADPYGFSNLAGHYLKIVSFYLIYRAIIVIGLVTPYSLLFRELKLSEEALKESEERIRLMVEGVKDYAIYMLDPSGRVASWNDGAERIKGYKAGEVIGKHFSRFYPREDAEQGKPENALKIAAVEGSYEEEGRRVRKDGSLFWASVMLSAVRDEAGNLRGFAEVTRDITDRKAAEEERMKLAGRIRLLLDSTDEGIYGIDLEGKCIFVNKAASGMVGYTPEELLGKNMHEVIHHTKVDGSPYPLEQCPVFGATKTGRGLRVESEVFWKKGGSSFPVEYSSYPIVEDGSIQGAVVSFTDITGRKNREKLDHALSDINTAINSTLEFDEIMQRVIVESTEAIGAEAAAISIREGSIHEGDDWVVKYAYGFSRDVIGISYSSAVNSVVALAVTTKKPVAIGDAFNDERIDRELMSRQGIQSLLTIPLLVKNEVIGVLDFHYHAKRVDFTELEMDFAEKLAISVSLALENARLYEAERGIADTLQSAILTVPDAIRGVEISHLYLSATEAAKVGGDFYDFFELEKGKVGFIIGDVSGKGLKAAATTSIVKSTVRAFAYGYSDPAEVLAEANDVIAKQLDSGLFVTAIYGIVDLATGLVTMTSAGHPDPFVCRLEDCGQAIAKRNPPLGVFEGIGFDSFETKLQPGNTLILYTDGLIEAKRENELFGEERVREVLAGPDLVTTRDIVDALISSAREFSNNQLSDDMALVAIRYIGVPADVSVADEAINPAD